MERRVRAPVVAKGPLDARPYPRYLFFYFHSFFMCSPDFVAQGEPGSNKSGNFFSSLAKP